ncbi:MAG TPA: glycerol-3-phosphate 1-O-acyltransferase PlsY [Polyangiaceae bacterium]|nr:glycerol-3-phosphate 1-O-acyltransferase PlsY [Polyangiaceae bacterium]
MDRSLILSAAFLVGAYLAGSIPFGLLVAGMRGIDLRTVGSGNIGATNAMRALGKPAGAAVLFLDAAKGALPVGAARWLAAIDRAPAWLPAACALAAVLGHCYPAWLRFRGGKGVATSLGVFIVLDPLATAISAGLFAIVYAVRRVVSIGSLTAAIAFPIVLVILGRPIVLIVLSIATMLVIVVRHKDNIARMRKGREART